MKTKLHLWGLMLLAALSVGMLAPSCSDDTTESSVSLHYTDIGDIGPSMHYTSSAPSFQGPTPTEFAVASVKLDGASYDDAAGCFTADPVTGAIIIANTNELLPGRYSLSISCLSAGRRNFFADVVSVKMLSATPVAIQITPSVLEIVYEGAKSSKLSAQIAPKDEAVTISKYELVQPEGQEYFAVSKSGAIGMNTAFKGEILPGVYTPGIRLSSLAGTAIYESMLTVKITSLPLEVTYKPAQGRTEFNRVFSSPIPAIKGSSDEGVQWAIKEIIPASDLFTIDAATGVISLPENNELPIDSQYKIDLTVTNQYGSTDFAEVYQVKVVAFITPIDKDSFGYANAKATEACAFDALKNPEFIGDEAIFELGALPATLQGQIQIDAQTGTISAAKGNTIPIGEYEIPVKATNPKGEATTTAKLSVEANPNMFHKFGYGNNLGLDAESNFDQFRWPAQGSTNLKQTVSLSNGYNDFNGRKPTFTLEVIHNWAFQNATDPGFNSIDADGNLSFTLRGDRAGQIGYVRVTATLGEGDTAVSRSTIVFVMLRNDQSDVIEYTPYVHRANPLRGGLTGIKPTLSADVDKSKLMMSWRQNGFLYEGLRDATPYGGKLEAGQPTRTIAKIWIAYETDGIFNAASRLPFCYYTKDGIKDDASMSRKVGYFDPANDFQIYIAPNKWMADAKPVNGIVTFQATYSTTANNDDLGKTAKIIGCAIWFDENF